MKTHNLHLHSGIKQGIPLQIDANWTPEQAMAVFTLLNDLIEQIWQHYGLLQLQPLFRDNRASGERGGNAEGDPDAPRHDEKFIDDF